MFDSPQDKEDNKKSIFSYPVGIPVVILDKEKINSINELTPQNVEDIKINKFKLKDMGTKYCNNEKVNNIINKLLMEDEQIEDIFDKLDESEINIFNTVMEDSKKKSRMI